MGSEDLCNSLCRLSSQVLLGISDEVILRKQQAIAILAPSLQYSIPPWQLLSNSSDRTPWEPPFQARRLTHAMPCRVFASRVWCLQDAADRTLDGMFERAERLRTNRSTGIPTRLLRHKVACVRSSSPFHATSFCSPTNEGLYFLERSGWRSTPPCAYSFQNSGPAGPTCIV